ncbi:MAG: hypothetical protein JW940_02050 [Polyangiaceae bacterium]|nr:hypothetical protein [Polyangiaceae bacterium]
MVNVLGNRCALVVVAAGLALGCGPAARAAKAPAAKPAQATSVKTEPRPRLPQPTLTQRAGRLPREKRSPITLPVTGQQSTTDGVYLDVSLDSLPVQERSLFYGEFRPCGDPLPGPRAVQVVQTGPGSVPPTPSRTRRDRGSTERGIDGPSVLLVRLAGPGALPSPLELTLRACSSRSYWSSDYPVTAGYERAAQLVANGKVPIRRGIAQRFLQEQSRLFLEWARAEKQSHFGAFAAGRLAQAADASTAQPARAKPPPRTPNWIASYEGGRFASGSGDLSELMDFYTGSSQVLAAMAVRRGLGQVNSEQAKIKLSSIESVSAPPRDYDALIKALPNRSGMKLDPLARHLPTDALIVEFGSLRDLVTLGRDLDRRFGAIAQALEGIPGPHWLQERYRQQLAVRLDGLAERFGQVAIGSVALVLSDPYLREGSDVALVFEVRDQALFSGALAAYAREAQSAHPDLTETRTTIEGRSVLLVATPDGSIRRYQAELPRVTVLTNSLGAMRRLLAVHNGNAGGLADSVEYRYARTVTPYAGASEAAFAFFGDGFLDQVTGPRSKILESRRVRAQVELQAVDYAALLYGWMQGQRPTSLRQLLGSPWLGSEDLKHFDGRPISWTPELGASSSWGTAFHLSPIIDEKLELVSNAERTAYDAFRSGYESGWREGLDPTLARLMRRGDGRTLTADITILPINALSRSNRNYSEMVEMVGAGRVVGEITDGAVFTLAIGRDSKLRSAAEDHMQWFGSGKDLGLSFVGDWVQVGVADRAPLWDLALSSSHGEFSLPVPEGMDEPSDSSVEKRIGMLPAWAAVQIRNPLTLAATLTALRAMVKEAAPGLASWNKDAPYRGIEITRVDATAFDVSLSIHYCVARDVLLMALGREVLERRIDAVLEGKAPQASSTAQGYQLLTTLQPEAGGVFRPLLALLLDREALSAHQAAARGYEILHRGLGPAATSGDAGRALALRYLGYAPESPQGGALRWTSDGLVEHAAYGSALEPAIPDAKDPTLALHQAIGAIISVSGAVKLEERAREQEFHGRLGVQFAR